jgi:hypothetical protein
VLAVRVRGLTGPPNRGGGRDIHPLEYHVTPELKHGSCDCRPGKYLLRIRPGLGSGQFAQAACSLLRRGKPDERRAAVGASGSFLKARIGPDALEQVLSRVVSPCPFFIYVSQKKVKPGAMARRQRAAKRPKSWHDCDPQHTWPLCSWNIVSLGQFACGPRLWVA